MKNMKDMLRECHIGQIAIAALLLLLIGGVFVIANTQDQDAKVTEKVIYDKFKLNNSEILSDFETVSVNPSKFKKDADSGIVKINILNKIFVLELYPVEIQDKDAVIIIENESGRFIENAPPVYGYNGKVKGKPNSRVTLTVADDVILGIIEVDGKSYVIEQTDVKLENGKVLHVTYNSDMIKRRQYREYNTDGIITVDDGIREGQKEKSGGLIGNTDAAQSTTLTTWAVVTLLGAYDTEFQNKFSNPTAEISNMVNNVNNAYRPAGVYLLIKSYKKYTTILNDDACKVRDKFWAASVSDKDYTGSDLAFFFSGKEFYGDKIGCSYQFNGNRDSGYAVAQMVSAGLFATYGGSYMDRSILTAHETGHNFGAGHQDNSYPEYAKAYNWFDWGSISNKYTAMWTPYKGLLWPNYMQLEFSNKNNHGDSSHDNVRYISETKNIVAGYYQ